MADLTRRATLIIQLQDATSSAAKQATASLDDLARKSKDAAGANAQGVTAAQNHSRALEGLSSAAKTLAVAGLGALTGALVASVHAAGEFESSFGKIKGLTNTSAGDIDRLKASVIGLSRDLPVSANDLAKGLYFVSSSGYQGAEALKILEMAGKASAAGLGETTTIADAVTSALNAYGLAGTDAARITDLLTKAVIEGKGEPADLAASLGRVLPVAAAAGVSMEQVAASLSVMTRTGLSADEAATALRGTIGALLAPAKQSKDALAGLGISTDQVATMLKSDGGLVSVLELLMQRTGGNIEKLDAIIPNIRALTGVLSTSGSQGAEYARVLGVMENAAGATDKAFQAMSETFEFKLKKAQNSVENLGISIGNKLLPALSTAADAASTLIGWNDKLAAGVQGVNNQLKTGAATYEDYVRGTLGAAVEAKILTQAQLEEYLATGKVTMGLFNQIDVTQTVADKTGILSRETFEYGRMVEQAMAVAAKSGQDLRSEYAGLEKAQVQLADTAGNQLAPALEALGPALKGLDSEILSAAQSTEELTTRQLYQASIKDLPIDAALQLGKALGVVNEQNYKLMDSLSDARAEYAKTGDLDAYTRAVSNLNNELNSIKTDIKIRISLQSDAGDIPSMGHPGGTSSGTTTTPSTKPKPPTQRPGGPKAALGLDLIVPAGYPNDSYPLRVSSGERVIVQPATQRHETRTTNTYNYTTIVNDRLAAAMLLDQQRRERIARSNERMGVR